MRLTESVMIDKEAARAVDRLVADRAHSDAWSSQRVRDVPHAGRVEVVVRKPRLVCAERLCPRRTFTPATAELPARA